MWLEYDLVLTWLRPWYDIDLDVNWALIWLKQCPWGGWVAWLDFDVDCEPK